MTSTGQCQCGTLQYRLNERPLFVHACHCLDCQRRSGSAFGMTMIVLKKDFEVTAGRLKEEVISIRTTFHECATCGVHISTTSTNFPVSITLQAGTLNNADWAKPGAHIWTKRMRPWLSLSPGTPHFEEGYDPQTTWPKESLERLKQALSQQC